MAELVAAGTHQRLPSACESLQDGVEYQHPERAPILYYVEPLKSAATIEVSRVVKNGFTLQAIGADEFDKNWPMRISAIRRKLVS